MHWSETPEKERDDTEGIGLDVKDWITKRAEIDLAHIWETLPKYIDKPQLLKIMVDSFIRINTLVLHWSKNYFVENDYVQSKLSTHMVATLTFAWQALILEDLKNWDKLHNKLESYRFADDHRLTPLILGKLTTDDREVFEIIITARKART